MSLSYCVTYIMHIPKLMVFVFINNCSFKLDGLFIRFIGYVPLIVNTSRSFPRSWLTTGFVTRWARWVPLLEQELHTLPEHLSSPPVFNGVHVTRSLVLCVCFVDRCLSFYTFSFGHCVVYSSSIYGFWLPLWYLQTLIWQTHEQ